jgi:outer membrane protein insertion porin family
LILSSSTKAQELGRYELVSIDFEGNEVMDTDRLIDVIESRESPGWFSQFLNGISENWGNEIVFFDSLLINSDLELLQNFYFDNGFFKSKFSYKYELDNDDLEAELTFIIDENEPSFFSGFQISNLDNINPTFSERILEEIIDIDTTERYSRELVEQKITETNRYLRDHGHMLVSNQPPIITVDTSLNTAGVFIDYDFGRRYRISEVKVNKTGEGKDLVSTDLVRDLVGIKPGDYYSFYETERAQIRLYRTNLFNSALVTGTIADTLAATVPIDISTDIGLLDELSPEILVNDDNGLNLGFGLSYIKKNFLGDARKLSVSATAASQNPIEFFTTFSLTDTSLYGYTDARIAFEQPFIFGYPINTTLESFVTLQKRKEEWNATIFGASLKFDFELPRRTYLTSIQTYLKWENSEFIFKERFIRNSLNVFARIITQENTPEQDSLLSEIESTPLDDLPTISRNAILGVNMGANKTDNLLFPTEGYRLSILLEDGNSIPYLASEIGKYNFKDPAYYKVVVSTSLFLPVYDSQTSALGLKFKVGHIQAYKGLQSNISLNQRFSSGGSNSIRGWNALELVPEFTTDNVQDLLNLQNFTLQDFNSLFSRGLTPGGFFNFEGSIETRNRITEAFGTALFVDYGNTWSSYKDVQIKKIAIAAGFGFRIYTSFAPIRFDIGFKAYDPFDETWITDKSKKLFNEMAFHIGIGEAF